MTIERIPITSREQWLALRQKDVTASVVGALFGVSQYKSHFDLFMEKTGNYEPPAPSEGVLRRGLVYEPVVALMAAEKRPDWKITPAGEYLRDPDARLGATPDFYVDGDPRGRGVMQVKTVAKRAFRDKWVDGVPPFWISLQTLTEAMLDGAAWGCVAAWIISEFDEPSVEFFDVPRHEGVEARIRDAVAKFWDDVAAGREPSPDYAKDAELIARMYPEAQPLKTIDLTGNNMLPTILPERAALKDQVAKAEARIKEIDAEVKFAMGDAEVAALPGYSITFKTQHRKGYEVKPTSFRALRITGYQPHGGDIDDDRPF